MGNIKNYLGMGVLVLFIACQSKPKHDIEIIDVHDTSNEVTVSGSILNATMNTLTLITEVGDTVTFNTLDAEKEGSILKGDHAEVTYENTEQNQETSVPAVYKVIVSPAPEKLMGSWVEPTVIGDVPYQGIKLDENGVAMSINMETLTYESWEILKGQLILKSTSEGSGQPITCIDTFNIALLTPDSLVLENPDYSLRYGKLKK